MSKEIHWIKYIVKLLNIFAFDHFNPSWLEQQDGGEKKQRKKAVVEYTKFKSDTEAKIPDATTLTE